MNKNTESLDKKYIQAYNLLVLVKTNKLEAILL